MIEKSLVAIYIHEGGREKCPLVWGGKDGRTPKLLIMQRLKKGGKQTNTKES